MIMKLSVHLKAQEYARKFENKSFVTVAVSMATIRHN